MKDTTMNQITPYQAIEQKLISASNVKSLNAILGGKRGHQYALSVLAEIKKTIGDPRKDLSKADPTSILFAARDAAKLRLEIDGRQHAHLVKDGDKVQLQIGYRGYLARLQSSLQGFAAHVECVYKGDTVEVVQDGMNGHVKHIKGNPFGTLTDQDIIGVYAQLSYLAGNNRVTFVTTMNRAEIDKIRRSAKTGDIWNAWFTEKAKVACIRRACKAHFSAVTHDLDALDNEAFDLNNTTAVNAASTATLITTVQEEAAQ